MTNEELKALTEELKSFIDKGNNQMATFCRRLDGLEVKMGQPAGGSFGGGGKRLAAQLFENAEFKALAAVGRGRLALPIPDLQLELKTAITETVLGRQTTGVIPIERVGGITLPALRTFRVRELLRQIPTTFGIIDGVRATGYSEASPQVEASSKLEAEQTFEAYSEKIRCLAHWIPCSRQALQDLAALEEAIRNLLMAGLLDEEDEQILAGDGTGENLNGLMTLASPFNTGLLSTGWTQIDVIGRAIQQLETARYGATGIVLHPTDWWDIALTKDGEERYILGDPGQMAATQLFGRPVAVTDAQTAGSFLVGDFQTGAALYVRQDGVIEVSDSHSDYFIKNLVAIRCEERVALFTYKPGAFVTGTLTHSP